VRVALALLPRFAVIAVKLAELAAAGTVTEAGIVRRELLFARAMTAPPAGAAWDRVTVQLLEEFAARVLGVQDSEDTETGATRFTMTLPGFPA